MIEIKHDRFVVHQKWIIDLKYIDCVRCDKNWYTITIGDRDITLNEAFDLHAAEDIRAKVNEVFSLLLDAFLKCKGVVDDIQVQM